ncbi:hypothetical protein BpHYR1_014069 [Brachionus plicatilis]|uniref:Uncharacterized protein n=1 Tax=Brachionus plicatilis TaxID=10195 RepID=A0A3M7Q7S3_BRAPC|nr:hypothetical protein BpHYR1_014069 [Brachionus plicatilis]
MTICIIFEMILYFVKIIWYLIIWKQIEFFFIELNPIRSPGWVPLLRGSSFISLGKAVTTFEMYCLKLITYPLNDMSHILLILLAKVQNN